ncbi:MAG: YbeD family protein [Gammaproteobacteria bacterium]|jgi:putative lipoic acid-binding regulatory protein
MEAEDSLFIFPCTFPIKAMGKSDKDFDTLVVSLIRKHCTNINKSDVQKKLSNGGKYMSVTVTIQADNREQLDKIYIELTSDSRILYAL